MGCWNGIGLSGSALALAQLNYNDNVSILEFEKLPGNNLDINTQDIKLLLFNLTFCYAIHKKILLKAIRQEIKLGKNPGQFMNDKDLKEYFSDKELLSTISLPN